jgi:leucyl-tRNA synthetase
MGFTNSLYKYAQSAEGARIETLDEALDALLLVMAPMTPHITAELWERRHGTHVHSQRWPVFEPSMVTEEKVTMIVQVNGRIRARIEVEPEITGDEMRELAIRLDRIREHVDGRSIQRVVTRPPNLVNLIVQGGPNRA